MKSPECGHANANVSIGIDPAAAQHVSQVSLVISADCIVVRQMWRPWLAVVPVVVGEARPPVGRPQQGLEGTCQVDKQVTHQEEPGQRAEDTSNSEPLTVKKKKCEFEMMSHIVRMGATRSREAMRIPSSAIRAVSSRAQVGSPLAFPWPNT